MLQPKTARLTLLNMKYLNERERDILNSQKEDEKPNKPPDKLENPVLKIKPSCARLCALRIRLAGAAIGFADTPRFWLYPYTSVISYM